MAKEFIVRHTYAGPSKVDSQPGPVDGETLRALATVHRLVDGTVLVVGPHGRGYARLDGYGWLDGSRWDPIAAYSPVTVRQYLSALREHIDEVEQLAAAVTEQP